MGPYGFLDTLPSIGLIKRAISQLEDSKMTRLLIFYYTFIFGIDDRVRDHYQTVYGNHQVALDRMAQDEVESQDTSSIDQRARGANSRLCILARGVLVAPPARIDWQDFPKPFRPISIFRKCANVWLVYVVGRYLFSDLLEGLVEGFMGPLELPISCYLVGRFVISPIMSEMTGAIFAFGLIFWRMLQVIAQPYQLSMVYFLMLSEHDRELVYTKLKSNRSGELTLNQHDHLSPKEQFLIDTMCYCIKQPTGVVFKLRPNRTPDAHRALRRLLARGALVNTSLFILVSITLSILLTILFVLDSYYVSVSYPNCDPQLKQLYDAGQLPSWSMTLTNHHKLAFIGDCLENIFVWFECGIIPRYWPFYIYLHSYDLILHWNGIKQKIEHLEAEARNMADRAMNVRSRVHRSFSDQVQELIAEMSDFFGQINKVNAFISNYLLLGMMDSLLICAYYTYFAQIRGIQIPPSVCLALADLVSCTAMGWYGLLVLHRNCSSSYAKLCSLMAHDRDKSIHKYEALVEFYTKKRSCFRLLNQYPFTATTFLTVVGWSFTCFCVIADNVKRGIFRRRP